MDNTSNDNSVTPTEPTPTQPVASSNKKLIMIVGGIVGVLLVILIVLLIALLNKSDANDTNGDNSTTDSAQNDNTSTNTSRPVALRAPTSDDKLEYIIYKPEQNASNTTIRFAVRNICEGCTDSSTIYMVTSGFSDKTNSFLVDDNNGRKYSVVTDEDDRSLATPDCSARLKFDQTQECFVSFSKVPSGSTVSWVFGSVRIDGIKVQ